MPSKRWWLAGAAAALVAVLAWLGPRGGSDAAVQATAAGMPCGSQTLQFFGATDGAKQPAGAAGARARLRELQEQFTLVDRTYCDYAV
ncbi:hypothetical protein LP420_08445 [Massilia sp. B-10]|nr:hypothetical protein LP420_08445 [Massilia sp. B-10]